MGFQSTQSVYKPKPFLIMWGQSTQEVADEALVLGLENRSVDPQTIDRTFFLTSTNGQDLYQYWASPVSAGEVEFLDTDSQFVGGWDGANNDIWDPLKFGPITLNITTPSGLVVPYYVYRTDYNNLGPCNWLSRASTGH
jgi:hypothetical protein